jgi:UDP-N-acetyl-D-galactosamine dehydrogenase
MAKSARREIVGVVGLGYVGMPLAVAFSKITEVVGYDIRPVRVDELRSGRDHTGEADPKDLKHPNLRFTSDPQDLARCTTIIVAVPTPVNIAKEPDLEPLINSSIMIGKVMRRGTMVVYESTVYPGVTEDVCLPLLEKHSGLKLGEFDLAYSPERVNPGDKEHTVTNVIKIVSGHDAKALKRCAALYRRIVKAGLHLASNIKTAEAAKVIENVQRDLNIALMNELSKIFARIGIDTYEVIEAAGTKWNFHKYHPGLVGGHCIGVDPYYLTHRALMLGYHPEVILAGRRINDSMGSYVGELCIREMVAAGRLPKNANVWILGMTFKENVPDFRNSRAEDVVTYLRGFGCNVTTWEPHGTPELLKRKFNIEMTTPDQARDIDAIVLINRHDAYKPLKLTQLRKICRTPVLVDVKHFFNREQARKLGFCYVAL